MPELPKDNKKQRYQMLEENDYRRKLPEVEHCDDILLAFVDSGKASYGDGGASPLTWQEINAMVEGGCYALNAWAKRQLRKMSLNYCVYSHKSKKEIPSPYQHEVTEEEQIAFGLAQLKAMERAEAQNNEVLKAKRIK